ncbi:Phage Mu protein F like protein [Persephonella hydrogeniphila]|uniref:Phage Mu protein F like protein n=1 Tax=Persephonella hydrogeniphila TaxID=198703 RepID=A0A285NFH2_9AQUI|nr:hypothetical protein [Persephonella hydrogeniphila]SNZ08220.1 Phage Mu protein F like protein [Persephonella hydrogeniphila]
MANIKNLIQRKAREAKKKLLRSGNQYAKEYVKLLEEAQKEISQKLLNQEETPYQNWRLQNLLKEIEKSIQTTLEKPSKDLMKKIAEESLQEISNTLRKAFEEIAEKAKKEETKEIKETFKEVFKQSAQSLQIKESFFLIPKEAVEFLTAYSMVFSDNLAKDLISKIKKQISLGMLQGESVYKIARRIAKTPLPSNEVFRDVYDRALTIARTETARAYTYGSLHYYKKLGVTKVKWLCGGNPCPKCQARCNIIYEAEVGGDIPLHPNCTCAISPADVDGKPIVSEKEIQFSKEKKKHIRNTRKILKNVHKDKLPQWIKAEKEEIKLEKHLPNIFGVHWENLREDRKVYYKEKFYQILKETLENPSRVFYFDDTGLKNTGKYMFVKYKTGTIAIIDKDTLKIRTFFKVDKEKGSTNKERVLNYIQEQKALLEKHIGNKIFMELGDGEGKK